MADTPQSARRPRRLWRILLIIGLVLALCAVAVVVFVHVQSYAPEPLALEILENPPAGVTVVREGSEIHFVPDEPVAGLIFYPGGLVSYEAYAPLLAGLAEHGVLCVLLKMPLNLAVLSPNAAAGVQEEINNTYNLEHIRWYAGGHSLGGVMVSRYVSEHTDAFQGLLFFASYTTEDLHDTDLQVLSLYGSEDHVLNLEAFEEATARLPDSAVIKIIPGGCHAYFGCYGAQKGDGTPGITREEQTDYAIEAVCDLLQLAA